MQPRAVVAVLAIALGGCAASTTERLKLPPLEAVPAVDLARYVGSWYEIGSFPQWFQRDCVATTATYVPRPDGEVDVLNRCRKGSLEGREDSAVGRARVVEGTGGAKLEVSFFRPFWADYWIIDLDPDYRWAVVGHPGRDYLWVLSRAPTMPAVTWTSILARLQERGYDTTRIVRTEQPFGARELAVPAR
jgi:apolipoprotein D and lipocalin family protein